MIHELPLERASLHGHFSRDLPPVLTIDPGDSVRFAIGSLENGSKFPPGHLVEHQSTAQPIRVWYRTQDGVKVAIRLEDAT